MPSVTVCPKGYYGDGRGPCTACPLGRYKASVGGRVDSPGSPSDCQACPTGKTTSVSNIIPNYGTALLTASTSASACSVCVAGYYASSLGAGTCAACPVGTYKPTVGNWMSCRACPPGKFAATPAGVGNTACLNSVPSFGYSPNRWARLASDVPHLTYTTFFQLSSTHAAFNLSSSSKLLHPTLTNTPDYVPIVWAYSPFPILVLYAGWSAVVLFQFFLCLRRLHPCFSCAFNKDDLVEIPARVIKVRRRLHGCFVALLVLTVMAVQLGWVGYDDLEAAAATMQPALTSLQLSMTALSTSAASIQAGVAAVVASAAAGPVVGVSTTPSLGLVSNFSYTSTKTGQSLVVPAGVTQLYFELCGASGGSNLVAAATNASTGAGGKGGCLQATLAVRPRSNLIVNVGGAGLSGSDVAGAVNGASFGGGWNGGGNANWYDAKSGGGGGATDVRSGVGLSTRLLVAGGGGGAGAYNGAGSNGGAGGGLVGGAVSRQCAAGGGSQSAGGTGSSDLTPAASLGTGVHNGQNGATGALGVGGGGSNGPAGGGGGGYYGGGGGAWCSGGGGSNYADATKASAVVSRQGANAGNGYVWVYSSAALAAEAAAGVASVSCFANTAAVLAAKAPTITSSAAFVGLGASSVQDYISLAQANIYDNYKQIFRPYLVYAYFAVVVSSCSGFLLATLVQSKLLAKLMVLLSQTAVLGMTLVVTVEIYLVMATGDYCQNPITYLNAPIVGDQLVHSIATFYTSCASTSVGPFQASVDAIDSALYLILDALALDQQGSAAATSATCSSSLAGAKTALLSLLASNRAIEAATAGCSPLYAPLRTIVLDAVCGSGISGLYFSFLAHIVSNGCVFAVMVLASLLYPYFGPAWTMTHRSVHAAELLERELLEQGKRVVIDIVPSLGGRTFGRATRVGVNPTLSQLEHDPFRDPLDVKHWERMGHGHGGGDEHKEDDWWR